MRFLVVLLLLAVFFLTGLVVGMDKFNDYQDDEPVDVAVQQDVETVNKTDKEAEMLAVESTTSEDIRTTNSPENHMTQKTASFLEGAVKGFYDLVVGIIYQFTKAFF
ncbi:hypothetical protein ACFO3D_11700 [Virgibacillus kekensis]|uniref:DUF3679 domain-containing protein n=1 Tax=Virgibacillus kekensis TaxID=202261 RepID=A0ABV9DLK1_9BACI